MSLSYQNALNSRTDLAQYKHNAQLLFALQLRFQIEDIHGVATDALIDDGKVDDKKCDLIYVDRDAGYIIVAQGYVSQDTTKPIAKASKASDLNTGASWILTRPIEDLPECLQAAAKEVRSALEDNKIRFIQFWYVHNLTESTNVGEELKTVENTVKSHLKTYFLNSEVDEIGAIEVGQKTMEEWYQALEAAILVTDELSIPIQGGYQISDSDWEAYVTAIPAHWLYSIFKKYSTNLFSANVRGYLGSRKSDSNINYGIKKTAETEPGHFWVFNNGITALVHEFQIDEAQERKTLIVQGISIVNGAQTTGAIGNLKTQPEETATVQARFVKCTNKDTIRHIIEYNNRQNTVEASDFRSNDPIQRRLRQEFNSIPDAVYLGGRRGGDRDAINRPSNVLPSDTVAQALAAFHQDPGVAYNQKTQIWISDGLYSRYFSEQTNAEHIVFAYSLLRGIENKKNSLKNIPKDSLTEAQHEQLRFLQERGSTLLLTAGIAKCLETFLNQAIPNTFRVHFLDKISQQFAQTHWEPIIECTIHFCNQLLPAVGKLSNNSEVTLAIKNFKNFVDATKFANKSQFENFSKLIKIRT